MSGAPAHPRSRAGEGLYDPAFEHDACGVAFVATLTGVPSHDIVHKGLEALRNLDHRGATGAVDRDLGGGRRLGRCRRGRGGLGGGLLDDVDLGVPRLSCRTPVAEHLAAQPERGEGDELRRPIVQVGTLSGNSDGCPFNQVMVKSLSLVGSFRFIDEYAWAIDYLSRGALDVSPLLTATLPVARADEAFQLAGDRTQSMKVVVTL